MPNREANGHLRSDKTRIHCGIKLVKQVKHVYENVEYYRNLMDEKGVKPEDIKGIDDLYKLPFLSKADLRDAYPYGLLAKPLDECVNIRYNRP